MVINEEEKNAFTQSVMGDSEGGGGSIPEITEDDEGKVLTVDDGEAVWADSRGVFIVTAHLDDVKDLMVLDNTWNEIYEASRTKLVVYPMGGVDEDGVYYAFAYLATLQGFEPEDVYDVVFANCRNGSLQLERFLTNSADGYPEYWED